MRANPLLLIGEPETRNGESLYLKRLHSEMTKVCMPCSIVDLKSLLPYPSTELGHLNLSLIEQGYSPVELNTPYTLENHHVWVAGWKLTLAAFASFRKAPRRLWMKLQAHHLNERFCSFLYEHTELLISESLLANFVAYRAGIPHEKVVYLPHSFSENLPKKVNNTTFVVGICSRLEIGKNTEYALELVETWIRAGKKIHCILLGTFPKQMSSYHLLLQNKLEQLKRKKWFQWIENPLSHEEALNLFATFDCALHLSGAEAASQTVVDYLALGVPTLLLDCSSNPYLFKGGAMFTSPQSTPVKHLLNYYRPSWNELNVAFQTLLDNHKEIGKKGRIWAENHFHPLIRQKRLSSLLEGVCPQKRIQFFHEDCQLYGL